MANRNFPSQKLFNFHMLPRFVDMQVAIAGSGAPTLSGAPGVASIARKSAGIYKIQFQDNYYSLLGMDSNIISPVTGGAIDPNGAVTGSLYQISTVGNSDWVTAGVPATITPAVGVVFALAAAPGAGTGRVKLISASNIKSIELAGPLANSNSPATAGASLLIQCIGETITMGAYTPAGTVAAPVLTMNSYTPAGTVAAPVLTMNSYTPAGTNNSSTPAIFTGTPATLTGTNSAPSFTGSAATLTGTNSAPAFTGTAASLTGSIVRAPADPTSGSVLAIRFYFNDSSVQ